jgi:membrane-associated phospholipid phosphatase
VVVTTDTPTESPPTPSRVADVASVASDFGLIWMVVSAVQVLAGRQGVRAATARLGAAGIASLVLTRALKHYFAVPRSDAPSSPTLARTPTSSRFPSGHTLAAFVSALTIPRSRLGRLLAVSFATVVAWSRVRVGHHRAVDVVAGAAVGTVAGTALAKGLGAIS